MRLATFVVGIVFGMTGGISEASDAVNSSLTARTPSAFSEGALRAPSDRFITRNANVAMAQDGNMHSGAIGAMGFVPAQSPSSFTNSLSAFGEPVAKGPQRYNPANIPLPATRTLEDHLLTAFVALMLIAYQLRRKHRFLRPHQFST